jgi:ribulose-phosphate 3-epimerase
MSVICPTILADTVEEYHEQMDAVAPFVSRIQVDLGDGKFTTETISIADAWWPSTVSADIHLMYEHPTEFLHALVALEPHMVILHAEAREDLGGAITYLQQHGVKVGVALLKDTTVESAWNLIERSDHVLIFSGALGSFGGKADLSLLRKVEKIRSIKSDIEIGWDGGANVENARQLSDGGIDVINVGSAIQKANQPENAYRDILRQVL